MEERSTRLVELMRLFGKLGVVAFGGPAAHIAMFEDETVVRRRWLTREHFLDLVGATNLIPGPNSTEMVMHVGFERAGWRGLMTAGASFIFPAVLLSGTLAWVYLRYGTLPSVEPFLFGIKPAVLAVILGAVWRLGRTAIKGWRLAILAAAVVIAVLQGTGEITALLVGGVLGMVWLALHRRAGDQGATVSGGSGSGASSGEGSNAAAVVAGLGGGGAGAAGASGAVVGAVTTAGTVSLWKLGLFFLKVGAVLYGSGYVLVAFLEGDVVQKYHWLTQAQLLDAIAVGQFTPGPVLSTATFVGYVVAGVPGAAIATLGIFLPSFAFVAALNPIIPRLRRSLWAGAFLDAINAASVALMFAVLLRLGLSTLTSAPAWGIGLAAALLAIGLRVNAVWLVVGGAVVGWLIRLVVGVG